MKLFSLRGAKDAGFVAHADAAAPKNTRRERTTKRALSVKASLRLAFGLVLAGTLAIGAISLTQISRLNGATESIYTQGYVASRAAEETRGYLLRASRSQKMLLTAIDRERARRSRRADRAVARRNRP